MPTRARYPDAPDSQRICRPPKLYTGLGAVWFTWLGNLVLRRLGTYHLAFLPHLSDWDLSDPGIVCALLLLSAGALALMIYRQRAYVALTPDGFEYRGLFTRLRISWKDVRSVNAKTHFGDLEIRTTDGKAVTLFGFGKELSRDINRHVAAEDVDDAASG